MIELTLDRVRNVLVRCVRTLWVVFRFGVGGSAPAQTQVVLRDAGRPAGSLAEKLQGIVGVPKTSATSLAQLFGQPPSSSAEPHLGGSLRNSESVSNRRLSQILDVAKQEDLPIRLTKPLERRLDFRALDEVTQSVILLSALFHFFNRHWMPSIERPERLVPSDLREPGGPLATVAQLSLVSPSPKQGLLS